MKNYTITVNGKVYEVTVEEGFSGQTQNAAAPGQRAGGAFKCSESAGSASASGGSGRRSHSFSADARKNSGCQSQRGTGCKTRRCFNDP